MSLLSHVLRRAARHLRVARVRRRAVVRVPGTTANLGAGFDCVGAAVDRCLTASVVMQPDAEATQIQRGGTLAGLDVVSDEDWIVVGLRAACKAAGRQMKLMKATAAPIEFGIISPIASPWRAWRASRRPSNSAPPR